MGKGSAMNETQLREDSVDERVEYFANTMKLPNSFSPPEVSKTVLLVDDNPTNLEVLSELLVTAGVEVCVALDGESAIEQVNYALPSLILLDVMMPGIDGFETCRRLKSLPQTRDIPILFMTALQDTEYKLKGLRAGAVDYITKPFHQEEVLARVGVHLQLQTLSANLRHSNHRLRDLNRTLEDKVLERTAALSQALKDLEASQVRLVQQEKMSTLGQLIAGIAHEINNPISFIKGNLSHAHGYVQDLIDLINAYQKYVQDPPSEITDLAEDIDLSFVVRDLPALLNSMEEGTNRILQISRSMRTFSRVDAVQKVAFNLHDGLNSTLLILKHRLKADRDRAEIQIDRNYGVLPEIACYPGQLNQVLMNLLANAIDAFDEDAQRNPQSATTDPGYYRITIKTYYCRQDGQVVTDADVIADVQAAVAQGERPGGYVELSITDNGPGISEQVRDRIFDRAFTTKPVGKGTGLGLAIVRQIITDNHGGQIRCESQPGEFTRFIVQLPIA
jgi:signal transduction histidine kinase